MARRDVDGFDAFDKSLLVDHAVACHRCRELNVLLAAGDVLGDGQVGWVEAPTDRTVGVLVLDFDQAVRQPAGKIDVSSETPSA